MCFLTLFHHVSIGNRRMKSKKQVRANLNGPSKAPTVPNAVRMPATEESIIALCAAPEKWRDIVSSKVTPDGNNSYIGNSALNGSRNATRTNASFASNRSRTPTPGSSSLRGRRIIQDTVDPDETEDEDEDEDEDIQVQKRRRLNSW